MTEIRKLRAEDDLGDLVALSRTFFAEYEAHHDAFFKIDELQDTDITGYLSRSLADDGATFIAILEGGIVGYIVMSAEPEQGEHVIEELLGLWARHGEGDFGVFSRRLIGHFYMDREKAIAMCWGTEVRRRHSEDYVRVFERLVHHAEACDPDGMIADAIRGSSHGRVYRLIQEVRPSGPAR